MIIGFPTHPRRDTRPNVLIIFYSFSQKWLIFCKWTFISCSNRLKSKSTLTKFPYSEMSKVGKFRELIKIWWILSKFQFLSFKKTKNDFLRGWVIEKLPVLRTYTVSYYNNRREKNYPHFLLLCEFFYQVVIFFSVYLKTIWIV